MCSSPIFLKNFEKFQERWGICFLEKKVPLVVEVLDLSGLCSQGEVLKRATMFREQNIKYLQFFVDEIKFKSHIVESMVSSRLGEVTVKTAARKLLLKDVPIKESRGFFSANHLMGYRVGRTIGLYQDSELICALSYIVKKDSIEIGRFCTKLNMSCAGGFSKLVSRLKSFKKPIISFCDLRYADGRSYEVSGFKDMGETLGWAWTNGDKRFNRLYCTANAYLTEKQAADEKGLFKIYDAGQRKYRLEV